MIAVPAAPSPGLTRTAPDPAARHATRAAYTALGWVVLFFAFHVNWYLGGSFASPGKLPGKPHSLVLWIFNVFVDAAFPLGAFVCLAVARGWARGRPALPVAVVVRFGCLVLLLRGGAGIIDDLSRATGLLRNGITGLSTQDTTGAAHLSWAGWAIDTCFLTGGIIFGRLAVRHRTSRRA